MLNLKTTFLLLIHSALFTAILCSCVSIQDRELTANDWAQAQVLGKVSTEFTSYQFMHIIPSKSIKRKASVELMREARKQYEGNIEIRNIDIIGGWSGWQALHILGYAGGVGVGGYFVIGDGFRPGVYLYSGIGLLSLPVLLGNTQKITATADVILFDGDAGTPRTSRNMEEALGKAAATLIDGMPSDSTIAILSVYSTDRETSIYVIDELEYRLVEARKFKIVDRRRLDQIRWEQNFQLSGNVDDSSAVSIGNMLGASIVITGDISGSGASRRLVLRALDVRTAQIVTMAREQFWHVNG